MDTKQFTKRLGILVAVAAAGSLCGLIVRTIRERNTSARAHSGASHLEHSVTNPSKRPAKVLSPASCNVTFSEVPPELQTDSTKPDYDPVKLLDARASALDVFRNEVRNEKWASGMENGVGAVIRDDLRVMLPDIQGFSMECRTQSCMLSWKSMGRAENDKAWLAIDLARASPVAAWQADDAAGNARMLLFFRRVQDFPLEEQAHAAKSFDVSDPAGYAAEYSRRRQRIYTALRTGARKLPGALHGIRLPE